jgi:hypothetical protein
MITAERRVKTPSTQQSEDVTKSGQDYVQCLAKISRRWKVSKLLAAFLYLLCSSISGKRKWHLLLDNKDLSLWYRPSSAAFSPIRYPSHLYTCSIYSSFSFITILLHHSFSIFCISFPFSPSVSFGKFLYFYSFNCSSSFSFFFTISSFHFLPHLLSS